MGAWGYGPFSNDEALDFVGDLSDLPDDVARLQAISAALRPLTLSHRYVDIHDVSIGVVAAALVALRSGAETNDPAASDWLATATIDPSADLRAAARQAFDRALSPTDNESYDEWSAGGVLDDVAELLVPYRVALT